MAERHSAVKGMNDVLPADSPYWEWLESKVRLLMGRYAYLGVRTPIVESTRLFTRGLGEVTDIVEKEMYSFEDRLNGEQLTLRPENTAGIARAVIEHSLTYDGPKRLFYMGPMFRHERPQRGRYRQFHQIGAEAVGFLGAELDVELILLAQALWKELGLQNIRLEINTLGQPDERKAHRAALVDYLSSRQTELDEDAARRLHSNPLRILDTKNPSMQALVDGAPKLLDFISGDSKAHFSSVCAMLDACKIDYVVNPRLVRGMDYYNLTVFEFVTDALGAQGTICGGGRYDLLIEQLGGKPTPAVGWAMGVERIIELLKGQNIDVGESLADAYAIVTSPDALPVVMPFLQELRAHGVRVQMHYRGADGFGSIKSQFKKADASKARYALVFGPDELANGAVTVKPLRDKSSEQWQHSLTNLSDLAATLQSTS